MSLIAALLLAMAPLWLGASEAESVVVDVAATPTLAVPQLPGWAELEPKLQGPEALPALDAYLSKHATGPAASRAQFERARRLENLEQAMLAYRASIAADPAGRYGRTAALELGKLEYAIGRPEAAMASLDSVPEEDLDPAQRPELVFWRAQTRLLLKGVQRAQDDFESFLKNYPEHSLADAAALGVADCDAALKNREAALAGYAKLYQDPPSSVAPQALWQAASLNIKTGHPQDARPLLQRLSASYPDSIEAGHVNDALAALPAPPATPVPAAKATPHPLRVVGGHFTVQVGAYVQRQGAVALFRKLKKNGYAARMDKRVIEDNVYHLVQVGRFKSKAQANKTALRLHNHDHLPTRVVDIP